MPIEFHCSGCQKVLRVPDDAAGKKAKCPQCGAVIAVPLTAPPVAPASPFGAPPIPPAPSIPVAPSPPSGNNPFGQTGTTPNSDNPYAPPVHVETSSMPLRGTGPAWESKGKSAGSYWETVKQTHGQCREMFAAMRTEGDMWSPLSFSMVGGGIGGLAAVGFQMAIVALMAAANQGRDSAVMLGFLACYAVAIPILMPLGMIISAAIYHLILMIYGGANRPYETTLRVVSYVNGSVMLWNLIPFLGGFIGGICGLVFTILGLSAAHGISGFKATMVVLTPVFVCCGLYLVIVLVVVLGAAGAGNFR